MEVGGFEDLGVTSSWSSGVFFVCVWFKVFSFQDFRAEDFGFVRLSAFKIVAAVKTRV